MATIVWKAAVSGDFAVGANWSSGAVPGSSDVADLNASGAYSVTSSANEKVERLLVSGDAAMNVAAGTFSIGIGDKVGDQLAVKLDASVDVATNATLELGAGVDDGEATESLAGSLVIANGGQLLTADGPGVIVEGDGAIDLSGPAAVLDIACSNFSSGGTIQGAGLIESTRDDGGLTGSSFQVTNVVDGKVVGVVDGNIASATLIIDTGNGGPDQAEAGTFEATNGGGLEFLSSVAGAPLNVLQGNNTIQAVGVGSHVDLDNVFIRGGGPIETSDGGIIQTLSGGGTFWDANSSASVLVNDATTLVIGDSLANTGTISVGSATGAATLELESNYNLEPDMSQLTISLTGNGMITLSDDADNVIAAMTSSDTLINDGNTISGAGQIGVGGMRDLTNGGVIDATGTNALVVNVAAGKVTNQAKGFLEGSGSGGLSLAGGTFTDSGTVEALDGSSVTFGSGTVLTNDSSGTLTGGAWLATDTGEGAALTLSGPAITTLAATVELSGANSTFDTGSTALESSLSTIAAKGKLELLADRGWSGSDALTDDGLLQLGGGAFSAPGLTVNAGGTVSGFGDVSGLVTNDGVVQAYRGTLDVTGNVSGSGTLKVWGSSTLIAGGMISASESVLFATGLHATLTLGDPQSFASTISNWALGDTIDLAETDVASAQISGDTLTIDIQGGGSLDYTLANAPTNVRIVLASDGDGGTNLTLYKAAAPAVARLTQAMAALPSAAPAGATHAAETAVSHAALIAASRA